MKLELESEFNDNTIILAVANFGAGMFEGVLRSCQLRMSG